MSWTVTKDISKEIVYFEQKTEFGDLFCTLYHTTRPTGFLFHVPDSNEENGVYNVELVTGDYVYYAHMPSAELLVLNPTPSFIQLQESQCLKLLKPYLDEITGGLLLDRYYRHDEDEEDNCPCCPCCGCTCDDWGWEWDEDDDDDDENEDEDKAR